MTNLEMTVDMVRENIDEQRTEDFMIRLVLFTFQISRAKAEALYNEAVRIVEEST